MPGTKPGILLKGIGSLRHGRPCAGHLDWKSVAPEVIGITGTRPVMT
ncbi:hypothetical protein [Microvirga mediterraneensis]|uniref:Uncharacterized protein n=1 Tax=Microvirga mediterraneensis TaxID=2754695 RepID=A0A838BNX8_9HYPH|nr:hypothetical protein [Microvirga mediterraneensis]MBA1157100.1 hypothetical protein [Microvirga mediterraneensis]